MKDRLHLRARQTTSTHVHTTMSEEKAEQTTFENAAGQISPITGERMVVVTADEEKAVLRKLDWHILPLLFLVYTFSNLDRSNLGNARLAGLAESVNLESKRYDWLGTAFYIACEWVID